MESRRKEILEKLRETCQISLEDSIEQMEIIEKQEKEILKYKSKALKNINKILWF